MPDDIKPEDFGRDFFWGASVSSHQVEGGNRSQWTKWEHETAPNQAKTASSRLGWLPIWKDIEKEATNPLNYVSGKGIEHYKKYRLDFKLATSLHFNALRGGIEWSRINPSEGKFDPKEIDHYSKYFKDMKNSGLEPFVNLFHWTLPIWFAERGGFSKRSNIRYWRDYVHTLVQNMDLSDVKYIITINEANTYMGLGYGAGEFPPGEKNIIKSYWVYINLAKAHRVAYKIIKSKYPDIQVGVAHQCNKVSGTDFLGKVLASIQRWHWNWLFLNRSKYHDFIGVNYYFSDYRKGLSLLPNANPKLPVNDLGWYMEPEGIGDVLSRISAKYRGKPIIITENGVADMHDTMRQEWIARTLRTILDCKKNGANVIGYLHWSLLDNFEWQYGWFPKFGLVSVNRKTMQRSVKKSAVAWANWLNS